MSIFFEELTSAKVVLVSLVSVFGDYFFLP